MSITDRLQGVNRLFLDTAPVIYFVEQYPQYFSLVREVFEQLRNTPLMGVISPITLAECLVQPYRLEQTELQQDFIELMTDNNNIEFVPIDDETIAINAAEIRARYNLQLPDAFQITVALAAGCEAFLTNDVTFKCVTELRVLVLDDFNTSE
ncbi:MAG: PIN domain-containing protein [Tolypothrix sp. T3-bin4]|nr:PIN domain-containing protein [Tolypothrix sp. Co-bin9]MBD0301737.1 PIN domain-containing protein [Tolypothrix sp. T3-bin4]